MPNRRELGYVSAGSTSTVYVSGTATGYGVATGGTSSSITVSSENYTLLTFTSDSNLVVSTAGLFDVLLIGGGGSGGMSQSGVNYSGGGGAGQLLGFNPVLTVYLAAATYSMDIGAGGVNNAGMTGKNGKYTSLGSVVLAIGGGGGGQYSTSLGRTTLATAGGSSGGRISGTFNGGGDISLAQGFGAAASDNAGGGGSSASSVGSAGGAGTDISTWLGQVATTTLKAGGGGGLNGGTGGAAGSGGASAGANGTPSAPTANSGSGCGGGTNDGVSTGASGIAYIRFKI